MDFYLTGPDGRVLHFPMNPEEANASTGAETISFRPLDLGTVRLPRGKQPATVSWEGIFPGQGRTGQPFVKDWRPPGEALDLLQAWRDTNARLRLLITETPFNLDVFIEKLDHNGGTRGGMRDIKYTLQLTQWRELVLLTDTEYQTRSAGAATAAAPSRPTQAPPSSYTVADGDSLWDIARRVLGDGSQWRRIYDLNQASIGTDPDAIQPGTVLRIPPAGGGGG